MGATQSRGGKKQGSNKEVDCKEILKKNIFDLYSSLAVKMMKAAAEVHSGMLVEEDISSSVSKTARSRWSTSTPASRR